MQVKLYDKFIFFDIKKIALQKININLSLLSSLQFLSFSRIFAIVIYFFNGNIKKV